MILIAAHHWFHDVIGGSFRLATEFAEHLASIGHETAYICCGPENQTEDVLRTMSHGVSVIRYCPPGGGGRFARLKYHIQRSQELTRELAEKHSISVVNGHSPLQYAGAIRGSKSLRPRTVYTVHSPFDDELLSNSREGKTGQKIRLAAFAARWVERKNVVASHLVQTDSAYTLAQLRHKYNRQLGDKGVVAPGWVDCERFQPAADRRAVRTRLGGAWNTDLPIFLTVRRLEARMGVDTLIRAAGIAFENGAQFRLLIGGSGSLKDALRGLVHDLELDEHVHFLGRVSESDLQDCYAAADCFVLPTRALECFGLIVLEAMAAGTPVIASNVAAIPELAEQQGSEWMFPVNDELALADRMLRLLDGRLRSTRDIRAIAERYDRARIFQQWTDLLCP